MLPLHHSDDGRSALPDGATVAVVGGGPAAAFFCIQALREARERGRDVRLLVFEQKTASHGDGGTCASGWSGCNHCAGGISPRLVDALREHGLDLPEGVVQGRTSHITVHGDWKSIELPVPPGREMLSVFRGTRPERRPDAQLNLDSFLLERAVREGATVVDAEVRGVSYSAGGRPIIAYGEADGANGGGGGEEHLEADLAVFAAGVNRSPGIEVAEDPLLASLTHVLPGFRPPQVRKAFVVEMETEEDLRDAMRGEMHFVPYGSRGLKIELASVIPKGRWTTVVLLGKSIDRAPLSQYLDVVERFLDLPHIRRALPQRAGFHPVCVCHPNMTVGVARGGVGERLALIGDLAVSRLYKDGLYSAFLTSSALARCVLERGVDRRSLEGGYWPEVTRIHRDNRSGRAVFALTHVVFSRPMLSRVVYQAVLTERRNEPEESRRLGDALWRIASGDDTYARCLAAMFRPVAVWRVVVGGALITARNWVTEKLFGLSWKGVGRYQTGVARQNVERRRADIVATLGVQPFGDKPNLESMYSIRIRSDGDAILRELEKFGDDQREYFTPRLVHVRRTSGTPTEVGTTIRYDVTPPWYSFSVALERIVPGHCLLYRALDGFPRDGILAFDVQHEGPSRSLLTIYLVFDFPRPKNPLKRVAWWLFRLTFPGFVHDVLWNHALCRLKYLVERGEGDVPHELREETQEEVQGRSP
jgi:flavin-dependent dehydrogenase